MNLININQSIINNPLEVRSILTIPSNELFGLEIELNKVNIERVHSSIIKRVSTSIIVKEDKSLDKGNNAEIVTPPLHNTRETWKMLENLSKCIERLKPIYEGCSFQINYDASLLPTLEDKIRFAKLFAVYEDIVYRFSRGYDESLRASIDMYAYPTILHIKSYLKYPEEIINILSNQKRFGICFKDKEKKLIEIRTPNSTSDLRLWQNYITTFYYLIRYATHPKCDVRVLDEYIETFYKTYLLEFYNKENKEKAYTLAKKIFPNNIDQAYFMNQYLQK